MGNGLNTARLRMQLRGLSKALRNAGYSAEAALTTEAAKALSLSSRHLDILAEHLAEIKATSDGKSEQPIASILDHCVEKLQELEGSEEWSRMRPQGG